MEINIGKKIVSLKTCFFELLLLLIYLDCCMNYGINTMIMRFWLSTTQRSSVDLT